MTKIHLQSVFQPDATQLSNQFIDQYMSQANGDFVKVYIYLLRCLSDSTVELNTARIADRLLCTEGDVLRALKYWETQRLLTLHFDEEGQLSSISLCDPKAPLPENVTPISAARATTLSADRVKELNENEDIRSLLYVAEQYMGRPLNSTETRKILFFYDELHMSADLIDYLIEYCVSRGHSSIHYIDSVAQAWAREGITTPEAARKNTSPHRKEYFTILRAMGVGGRNPVSAETEMMNTWLDQYALPLDIILEACRRTVIKTGQASFPYTDKILSDWHTAKVETLADVAALDQAHAKRASHPEPSDRTAPGRASQSRTPNRFNNFQQRDYNFDEYERKLLAKS